MTDRVLLPLGFLSFGDHAVSVRLEFKWSDLWVGLFVKAAGPRDRQLVFYPVVYRLDVWICLVPCLPIHLTYWKAKE